MVLGSNKMVKATAVGSVIPNELGQVSDTWKFNALVYGAEKRLGKP